MTSPLRPALLPAIGLSLALGACSGFQPLADQSTTPDWVRDRLAGDQAGRQAPSSVPVTSLTPQDSADIDANAAQVMRLRARQAAEFARIAAEGEREVDEFVAEGRDRTRPPE